MTLFNEPPWLIAKVDRRIAEIRDGGAFEIAGDNKPIIATFLDEGDHEMTAEEHEKWERTCDGCGQYCPTGEDGINFYTGHTGRIINGRQVLLTYGVCENCKTVIENDNQKGTEE